MKKLIFTISLLVLMFFIFNVNFRNEKNNLTKSKITKIEDNIVENKKNYSLEKKLYTIISKENKTAKDAHEIIEILPNIDFSYYANIAWKNVNDIDDPFDITIITELETISIHDIENIIKTAQHSDGEYSETLSWVLAKFYKKDKINFMKALYKIPSYEDHFYNFLLYECIYGERGENTKKIEKDKLFLLSSDKLSNSEKNFVKKIFKNFNDYKKTYKL
ncbi:hypothetical protein [Tepidibacter thalassicus]|uniref:Uncharacterized protein n=1 Tax=Tepidibacter thalassicus DSM 15285 TaxID=1123350 RepID=A0A1M5TV35_9FIRM|nr:hypothetical protein [Tepidibacter thalassicus]SHH54531.1 hypothetical protein SAMN02744040_02308 [Tepidibacter thalassicus DSM 15285]